jgi:D-sedoheptulose 7-phosphate isomerase
MFEAYKKGKRIFIMGNGGSATTAMHFARDLQIGTAVDGKPRVRATCLADNVAFITALANDIGYDRIFEEQLVGQMAEGDVIIGISASGNSPNVLKAIEYARKNGAVTIGLVGFGGGKLKDLAHKSIVLSKKNYQQVEDIHMVLAHIIPCWIKNKINDL